MEEVIEELMNEDKEWGKKGGGGGNCGRGS